MGSKLNNVVAGTLLLSASSIFVRMVGFFFRIYLSNTIGAQGMGLYTLIMSLYALGTTIATSGVSLAVSKLVAAELALGNRPGARLVLRRALTLSLGFGLFVFVSMFFFAEPIALYILKDARCAFSLRLLAPGMPFLAVSACFRGYFIAGRSMTNPAASQVLEQLFKMGFIIILLGYWLPKGIEYACAAVVLGITFGELVCFAYTVLGFALEHKTGYKMQEPAAKGVTRKILEIIVPVSFTSYIRSGLRLLEDVLILAGLKVFMGMDDAATGAYGRVKGMVMPLLIFPLSLLSSFVVTLTPEISRLGAGDSHARLENVISRILQVTCIIGIFIVGVFMTFSYELGVVIYHDEAVGTMLKQMAFLCPFMCVEMVVVSILYGLGEQNAAMRYSLCDCVLRVSMVYFLIPKFGVNGFVAMIVASNLFTSALNFKRLLRITKIKLKINDWFIKPVLAAAAAGQAVKAVCNFWIFDALSLKQGLFLGLAVIAVVYAVVLFSVGSITKNDVKWISSKLKLPSKSPKPRPETVADQLT